MLPYLKVWSFLHGDSSKMPKVLLVPHPDSKNPELDAEAPTWFSSAALAFKSGKKKTASFGVIAAGDDAKRAAGRFALAEHASGIPCPVDALLCVLSPYPSLFFG